MFIDCLCCGLGLLFVCLRWFLPFIAFLKMQHQQSSYSLQVWFAIVLPTKYIVITLKARFKYRKVMDNASLFTLDCLFVCIVGMGFHLKWILFVCLNTQFSSSNLVWVSFQMPFILTPLPSQLWEFYQEVICVTWKDATELIQPTGLVWNCLF